VHGTSTFKYVKAGSYPNRPGSKPGIGGPYGSKRAPGGRPLKRREEGNGYQVRITRNSVYWSRKIRAPIGQMSNQVDRIEYENLMVWRNCMDESPNLMKPRVLPHRLIATNVTTLYSPQPFATQQVDFIRQVSPDKRESTTYAGSPPGGECGGRTPVPMKKGSSGPGAIQPE
jgi:hypothetical protein